MRALAFAALAALLLWADQGGPRAAHAQGKAKKGKAAPTPFTTVVRAHFDSWDANDDGELTPAEIEAVMIRPKVKGDEAAAIATLKYAHRYLYQRRDKVMPAVTREQLRRYEATGSANGEVKHEYDRVFKYYRRKLAETPRELFPEGEPRLTAIEQGDIGDCWFMSMVGALAKLYPEKIKAMIERDGKGYVVKFAGRPRGVFIFPPTDAEIALYTSAEKNGLWLTVLEKAFAKAFLQQENRKEFKEKKGKVPFTEALEGGYAYDAVALLTGFGLGSEEFNSPRLQRVLQAATAQKCLIATGLRGDAPPGLWQGHVYAVLGYDPRSRLVTVFDSLGESFKPEGRPGPKNGYEINHGVLTIPFEDFRRVFNGINYEDRTAPVHHEPKKKGKD